jgi:hypothetical protein
VIPLAHIAGIPVEETIASLGPALVLTFASASALLRTRLRRASKGMHPMTGQLAPRPGAVTPPRPHGARARH